MLLMLPSNIVGNSWTTKCLSRGELAIAMVMATELMVVLELNGLGWQGGRIPSCLPGHQCACHVRINVQVVKVFFVSNLKTDR